MNLLELPEDILSIIYLYLDPSSFLLLCQSSKILYESYRQDSTFWRTKTSTTFRIPVSPLLRADGARWYWLYKRLKTQTKLYTWGQGLKGNLGRGRALRLPRRVGIRGPPIAPPRMTYERTSSSWPTEAHVPDEVGVIADLQCGGWSTTILSSSGRLYSTGSIDSKDGLTVGRPSDTFVQLEYLTQSTSAVRQFSAGRRHVLALTDDAEILSWDRINAKGVKIFSRQGRDFGGKPVKVVAGWEESAAYTPETGIVYWAPVKNDQTDDNLDGFHVKEKVIPGTARRNLENGRIHEVVAFIVLERFIVWITSESKVWACDITHVNDDDAKPEFAPFQIPGFDIGEDQLRDIQGSFRNFVVFTSGGRVLAGNKDFLTACYEEARARAASDEEGNVAPTDPSHWSNLDDILASRPADVPALQHRNVVAVAFGDHHFHALHSNGKITSYGTESQACGSLGLGQVNVGGVLRGLKKLGISSDLKLLRIANIRGREVWFEPEKKDWLAWLMDKVSAGTRGGQHNVAQLLEDPATQTMLSQWIEQEGRHWADGPANPSERNATAAPVGSTQVPSEDYSHLGSYFAIAVSAAGWHSGALVLVDEDKAEEIRQLWVTKITQDTEATDEHTRGMPGYFEAPKADDNEMYVWNAEAFPRIQLPNGQETSDIGEVRIWRDGMPAMGELGIEQQ